jgi:gliding motility associated protien GldN
MKRCFAKISLLALFGMLIVLNADAQRSGRSGRRNSTDTSKQTQQQVNNNNAPTYNPTAGIPIVVDSAGMKQATVLPSLRNDNAFDKGSITARTPLEYDHIRWDDAFYAEKVWRELDLREKLNLVFKYEAEDNNGSQMFVDILLKAINNSDPAQRITAFADDRFTTPMTTDELTQQTAGSTDTIPVYDPNDINRISHFKVTKANFDVKSVNKLLIKEEWVFDRESSRLVCRILGIAPLKTKYLPSGQEQGQSIMFWVYYPDLRPTLAKYEVYNPKNMGQSRMTWEELFESRMFSSYIVKSTLDNPSFKPIRALMNQNQILSLLEGDNIRDKIFNFEQNLWSY